MITAENITSHELIGLHAKVIDSSNPQLVGLNGTVVDETKSMLKIDSMNEVKSVPKNISILKFLVNGNNVVVAGSRIAQRPFDRLGRKV